MNTGIVTSTLSLSRLLSTCRLMDIEITFKGDIPVIRLSGRIIDGESAAKLQETFQGFARDGRIFTIIDLEHVTYFDSLAIGLLIAHYISVSQRGGRVLLLKADEKIRILMRMTRLEDRFAWVTDLEEALRTVEETGLARPDPQSDSR